MVSVAGSAIENLCGGFRHRKRSQNVVGRTHTQFVIIYKIHVFHIKYLFDFEIHLWYALTFLIHLVVFMCDEVFVQAYHIKVNNSFVFIVDFVHLIVWSNSFIKHTHIVVFWKLYICWWIFGIIIFCHNYGVFPTHLLSFSKVTI